MRSPHVRVVRGRLDETDATGLDALREHLSNGGALLLSPEPDDQVAAELEGVNVARQLPAGEWIVTLTERPEAVRLDHEATVRSMLRILGVVAGDVATAASCSIELRNMPVITTRRSGAGRLVACGVADLDLALAHPTLGRLIERLLRADLPTTTREVGVGIRCSHE